MTEFQTLNSSVFPFDARGVAKRFRHAAIFGALESLHDGETMRFVNDHDPLPLIDQINQRYGGQISVAYVAREAGNIVIDFSIRLRATTAAANESENQTGGCGGGGGGCGCASR